jgi:competence protein ComEA
MESLPTGVRRGELGLERGQALVVVLVVLLGLAVAALLTGLGRPRVASVDPAASSTVVATGTPAPDAEAASGHPGDAPDGQADDGAHPANDGAELVIHVAGKVANPGVVQLPHGSRVLDAIEAAGGADADVDLTPLNLARLLTDGEQVAVGIDPAPEAAPVGGGPAVGGLINLNTATADQLETLPGIGPTLAGQILLWREQNGRFTAIEELQEVSGIGPKKFAALADQVTV